MRSQGRVVVVAIRAVVASLVICASVVAQGTGGGQSIPLSQKCCIPAYESLQSAGPCVIPCTTDSIECSGTAISEWVSGGCEPSNLESDNRDDTELTKRPRYYQCTEYDCEDLWGVPRTRCAYEVDATLPPLPPVTVPSCTGSSCT